MTNQELEKLNKKHLVEFNKLLKGKTVQNVSWLHKEECEDMQWYNRPVVIRFTDGTFLVPQCDDEGNDGGALLYIDNKKDVFETIFTTR